jgi:hypothetical protein
VPHARLGVAGERAEELDELGGWLRLFGTLGDRVALLHWAYRYLLTVKQDTVKTGNRILDTLWEALIRALVLL